MKILRESFAKVTKDPDLLAEGKKLMMDVQYVPADEILKVIKNVLNQPPDVIKDFSKYVQF